jgi:uncharacterized membrane protein
VNIPIVDIIVLILLVALAWWLAHEFLTDMPLKIARVVIVVIMVLALVGLLTGRRYITFSHLEPAFVAGGHNG